MLTPTNKVMVSGYTNPNVARGLRTKEEQGMVESECKRLRIVFVSLNKKKPMKGAAKKLRPTHKCKDEQLSKKTKDIVHTTSSNRGQD
ncbi:unnamed protein product [Sphenostylis stenocarpa]|uniref:Uncharacterized protein n=1 Tax=Sphenostylis stenocarpa TaxID=92480 RepID=A0AA86V9I4_9FABA|nr:unnamed protein product [Sphenostylis stenocarpa]